MGKRVFLQDEIVDIIDMYNKGCIQREIADKHHTTQGTISGVIKRNDPNYFVTVMGHVYKNDKDYAFKKMQRRIKKNRDYYKYTGQRIESELLHEINRLLKEAS